MGRKSLKNKLFILFLLIFFLVSVVLYFIPSVKEDEKWAEKLAELNVFYQVATENNSGLTVEFVNVGQGDCTFISCNGKNMLIDSGESEYYQIVEDFLKKRKITHFDYVLLSHPHSDHGGGMEKVIDNYSIGAFLLPDVNEKSIETDDFYINMMLSLRERDISYKKVAVGETYILSDAEIEILGPVSISDEENEMSVVCMLKYGDKKFLFTGDTPVNEELQLIESDVNLDCDVLKVSHHGSNDATSDEFLSKADPDYAVISVGEYNEYKHPHGKTVKKLMRNNVSIYRTDRDETIRFRIPDKNSEIILP